MEFKVPEPAEVIDLEMTDGAVIHVRRHGKAGATRLFISHGNGFAADAYFPFWGDLAGDYDLFVFDVRNHGWNARTHVNGHRYQQIAQDLETIHRGVDSHLGAGKSVGVFHSMTARAAMKQATEVGWHWDAIALFDPPNMPTKDHWFYPKMQGFEHRLIEFALNRPERFESPAAYAEHLAATPVPTRWVEGALDLMSRCLLKQDAAAGDWVLSCRREYEAAIYMEALTMDLWPHNDQFDGPLIVIAADPELKGPPTGLVNKVLCEENNIPIAFVTGTDHMLQVEDPEACRRELLSFLGANGLAA
jgi:pimeloyl-ACP methyl ester carboxylesterase